MIVRRAVASVLAVLLATTGLSLAISPAEGGILEPERRPVIFVHGFAGSGNQFASQAMRFTSNGYDIDDVHVHEYDTSFATETSEQSFARLDALIDDIQATTGAAQVDLLGHSLGTSQMQAYLNSDPTRAADVAHYVNLDGAPAGAPPGGVPTLAVWGMGSPAREIVGATNVYFPDQTHTEVVTSSETFVEIYEFFNDGPPASPDVVRQPAGEVTIAGRALEFITNVGVDDATLDVFEVDAVTGHRVDAIPEASYALTGDGSWGPFVADPAKRYELVLSRDESSGQHHFYFEPFVHSDHLMRLLTSDPGAGIDALWDKSPEHANLVILRNKEWWGEGPITDAVEIDGTNVVNAANAPIDKRLIAMLVFDEGSDKVSDLTAPVLPGLPFITGVDHYMPATTPPDGTIPVTEVPRGGEGPITVPVPNWAGITDRVTVQFNDFHVTRPHAPEPPTDVVAVGGPLQATISWQPPVDDGGAPLSGFQVLDENDAVVAETAATVTEIDVIGLEAGTTPSFRVVAVNDEGGSEPSAEAGPVTILPATMSFSDVPETHTFFAEITWAAELGVTVGHPDGTFQPGEPLSRQAVAAFAHRLAGAPGGPFDDPGFSDVPPTHPFFDEIAFANSVGLVEGFTDGTFRPSMAMSRQEVAAVFHRSVGAPSGPFDDPGFSDVPPTHLFFDEIAWMATVDITGGFTDGTFRPADPVSRQEMMAFLYRATKTFGKPPAA